tara:strand:+ start:572 stop:853 length:282 start_codon:yes stop_codon:yes gene_type:complete
MVQQTINEHINNEREHVYLNNDEFLFIDDQTKNNKIIFMVFNTYILTTLLDYFQDFHTNNVIFIKENHALSNDLIQEIRNYEHLVEYGEYDKA